MAIKSPCIKICKLQDDVCIGCFRTVDEIKRWRSMANKEKQEVIENTKQRGYNVIEDDTK